MNIPKTLLTPPFLVSNLLNPPEIEKILDTTLTKENQRYYKVKWVKITWESEDDLAYFSNIVDAFWAHYTRECLLQPDNNNAENHCQFNAGLSNIPNKEVYSFVTVPPDEIVSSGTNKVGESSLANILSHPSDVSSADILSLSAHTDVLSSHSSMGVHEEHPSSDMLTPSIGPNALNLLSDPCKSLNQLAHEYDCSLNCTMSKSNDTEQSVMMSSLTDTDTMSTDQLIETKEHDDFVCCKVCSMSFSSNDELRKHQKESCINVTYKCTLCETEFRNKDKYLKHEKSHVNKKCPICDKEFQRLGHLKTHLYTHSNTRPYSCDQCTKAFSDKSSLTKHKLVHTTVRKYSCTECNMSFKRAQHLRRHTESHKDIKHFRCSHCGKEFHQKSALNIHLNTHSGLKPFTCTECKQCFADGSTLRRHSFIHSGEKPFKCKECEKSFSRVSSLKLHVKNKHFEEEEN